MSGAARVTALRHDWVAAEMAKPDFWFFEGIRLYSPTWHRRLARKHAGGPCGCESCAAVKAGLPGDQLSLKFNRRRRPRRQRTPMDQAL